MYNDMMYVCPSFVHEERTLDRVHLLSSASRREYIFRKERWMYNDITCVCFSSMYEEHVLEGVDLILLTLPALRVRPIRAFTALERFGVTTVVLADVGIVRQLMENFIDAAGQARLLLAKVEHQTGDKKKAGVPLQTLAWTRKSAPRLFDSPGMMAAHLNLRGHSICGAEQSSFAHGHS